jgi:hypothetical protein
VVLGALGKREAELGGDTTLNASDRLAVRRQAIGVTAQSALIAIVATAVICLL